MMTHMKRETRPPHDLAMVLTIANLGPSSFFVQMNPHRASFDLPAVPDGTAGWRGAC
jgi:hypothetical protein